MDFVAIGIAVVVAGAILSPGIKAFFAPKSQAQVGCGGGCAGCSEASTPTGCSVPLVPLVRDESGSDG